MTDPEEQKTQEVEPAVDYQGRANQIFQTIATYGPEDAIRITTSVDDFIQDALDEADEGKIDSPNAANRALLTGQLKLLDQELEARLDGAERAKTIPRAGGLRLAFESFLKHPQTADVIKVAIKAAIEQEARRQAEQEQQHEEAVEGLGEQGLDAAGIKDPLDDASKHAVDRVNGGLAGTSERAKNPKLEILFAPPVRPELEKSPVESRRYELLFMDDGPEKDELRRQIDDLEVKNRPIKRAQEDFDRITNQDTREYSVEQLKAALRFDPTLGEMLRAAGFKEPALDMVDALRTDAELRYSVGEYLLHKLDRLVIQAPGSFGDRILRNGQKSNDYLKLPVNTSSREYAAYLALAKLSGMFNYKVDSSDELKDTDQDGRIIMNQHRHATEQLLYST